MSYFFTRSLSKQGVLTKKYSTLSQTEPFLDAAAKDVESTEAKLHIQHSLHWWTTISLTFAALSFAILSAWLWAQLHGLRQQGSFVRGYETELRPAKYAIEVKQTRFTGAPRFTKDGTVYVPEPPAGVRRPKYVGTPTDAIDHEWNLLHQDRYFLLTAEEAREAWGPGYKEFWSDLWGGYVATVDMMHSLHCLDHIRKAFYPDTYPADDFHGIWHRNHCIDHLRQVVLCAADLTPIPSRYYQGIGHNYIDGDMSHTCRSWEKIREWVTERYNGSLAVHPVEGSNFAKSEAWRDQIEGDSQRHGGHM